MERKILRLVILALVLSLTVTVVCANQWWDPLAVERQIYTYLTEELKLNSAAACGILANIEYESNFQVTIVGDQGTSYGLCQWHDGRYTALRSFCAARGLDYRTVDGQLAYLAFEMKSSYASLFGALRAVENSPEGAYRAAYLWCVQFERPADMEQKAVIRGNSARYKYWNRYNSLSLFPVQDAAPEPEEIILELTQDPEPIEPPRQAQWVEEKGEGRRYVAEKPEKIYYVNRNVPPQQNPLPLGAVVAVVLIAAAGISGGYVLLRRKRAAFSVTPEEPAEENELLPEDVLWMEELVSPVEE
jgi:hypothetical protein